MYARALLLFCALSAAWCSDGGRSPEPRFVVDPVGLELPKLQGWLQDGTVRLEDAAKGGIALRLIREGGVIGSPRIDVVLEELGTRATRLDTYLARNLREMAALETNGQIRIQSVEQKPINVGLRRGWRVRHEYTVGSGASQVSLTQLSTFLVLDGRGITISAGGRTELFHPLADSVERVLAGISTKSATDAVPETPVAPEQPIDTAAPRPVDLGKIGGQ